MITKISLDLGEQPICRIIAGLGLKPHDLVSASTEQITHKMLSRGCKGRRLTRNVQEKIMRALNTSSGNNYILSDLFNY
jgi:hypothetical protein